jgi:hypothetical protein
MTPALPPAAAVIPAASRESAERATPGCGRLLGAVVAEVARGSEQFSQVHGFPAAAVQFVDLGAAAEAVGQDHGTGAGRAQLREQGTLGDRPADLAVPGLEAEVAGQAAAAGFQVLGLRAGLLEQFRVRVPAHDSVLVAVHLGQHRPADRRRLVTGGPLGQQCMCSIGAVAARAATCLAAVTEDSAVTAAVVWHIHRG